MAKKSMVQRELKRQKLAAKYAAKRAALKAIINNPESSFDEIMEAQVKLQKLPRDSSPSRITRRCQVSGARMRYTASLACVETSCARLPCAGMCPA